MISRIKLLVAIDTLFLFLLALSGSASGIISELFYALAFAVPIGITINFLYNPKNAAESTGADARAEMLSDLRSDFSISKKALLFTLPLIFPSILVILALSVLTAYLLGLFGISNELTLTQPFIIALITHALAPAVLEELLFRFIPIKLLSENKKTALVLSSLLFAFAHANLFQIPYALLAGVIFSSLYLLTGSIIPSLLLHFLNNTVSLASMYGFPDTVLICALALLTVASLTVIIARGRVYLTKIKSTFKGEKVIFSYYPIFFILFSLLLAIPVLFI